MPRLFQVSARDHSALILMSELAKLFSQDGQFLRLQAIADNMHLSQGYLEEIAACLKQAELIVGKQGPNGGYRLAREPQDVSLEDILVALEGPVELVDCQTKNVGCPVAEKCASKRVWNVLQMTLRESLRTTTLNQMV